MEWQPIETFDGKDLWDKVDLWLQVRASPKSLGMSDAFRVTECHRKSGKWYHIDRGEYAELDGRYITHWMPMPGPPQPRESGSKNRAR